MPRPRLVEQVGRVVGGRYRLLGPVGTGASADVYVADDVTLRRRVAVKVLHEALADDEGFLKRFRAEAQAVASLRHANIMAVFDWGEEPDGPFLVLEYLGGGSLRDLLDRGFRLTPSQAVLLGLEAARGLDHAHRRGLVHRDIKPANLLFDEEGRLAIADFGIARALAEATWTEPAGAVVGTARYASPEQARGLTLDGRADVYALALVLVEAVTGRVPFALDTTIATLMARLDTPIPAVGELGQLAAVIEAAGTVDPADRLDAAGLVQALDAVARELPRPDPLPLAPVERLPVAAPEQDTTVFTPAAPRTLAIPKVEEPPVPPPRVAYPTPVPPAPEEDRRRRRWPWFTALAVLLVAAAVTGGLYARGALAPTYPVPSLDGAPVSALKAPHFAIRVLTTRVTGEKTGVVISQDPKPGVRRKDGSTITVTESIGNKLVPVPSLAGASLDKATQLLTAAGLGGGAPRYDFSNLVAGTIIDWSPKAQAPEKATINLVVSKGPQMVALPNLASTATAPITVNQAIAELTALGIDPSQIAQTKDFNDTVPAGDVIGTTPAPGGQADRSQGTAVTLDISQGPQLVPVPDVQGYPVSQARSILQQAGLTVAGVYGPPGASVVVDQRPSPGTKVKKGSGVVLAAF